MNKQIVRCAFIIIAIALLAISARSAEVDLIWDPPTRNTDGGALTDLVGYIVAAHTGGVEIASVDVRAPATTVTVTNLPDTSISFDVRAVNSYGLVSDRTEPYVAHRERPMAVTNVVSKENSVIVNVEVRFGSATK